ncbi:hypothetical protein PHSY_006243 [Pseudozyma hubeiensis SY62]|uniref:Uncharacterized protein n=1 Tax=Pseudozyma hubeiensis (strain SY62) TaxID=1305764 RepID=R9PBC0_PSEHS|nr:hypothetical protein PHSY_006243 [Pseudozyma hubeiensis SY62]GAC98649.1 hypothetical protein PHSY_006243 [Pseudozyma hubeiensis SY62]
MSSSSDFHDFGSVSGRTCSGRRGSDASTRRYDMVCAACGICTLMVSSDSYEIGLSAFRIEVGRNFDSEFGNPVPRSHVGTQKWRDSRSKIFPDLPWSSRAIEKQTRTTLLRSSTLSSSFLELPDTLSSSKPCHREAP